MNKQGRFLQPMTALVTAHVAWTLAQAWRTGRRQRFTKGSVPAPEPQPLTHLPGVSVIVPAWKDASALEAAADALLAELLAYPGPAQVVVVAGGVDPEKGDAYERAGALLARLPEREGLEKILRPQEARGKNAALNEGLRHAAHDLIVFLDADTRPDPGWLTALVRPLILSEVGATTGNFRAYTRTPVSALFELEQVAGQQLGNEIALFGGGSIALTRRALDSIGGTLPEDVPVGVDWDLAQRLRQAGQRFAFVPEARVQTEIAQTWPAYWRGEVRWRRAYLHAQARHLGRDRSPGRLLGLAYVPLVQAALLGGWLGALLLPRRQRGTGLRLWALFAAWVLGRNAATPLKVLAFTGQQRWLRLIPASALGFVVSAAASWKAILTWRQLSAQFRGQRLSRQEPSA